MQIVGTDAIRELSFGRNAATNKHFEFKDYLTSLITMQSDDTHICKLGNIQQHKNKPV
jgi:hypothetical protein